MAWGIAPVAKSDAAFVASVSHELRTPLTTIQMAAEVLYESREEFSPDARRAAELLYAQVERFELLLADLLEISRFDAGDALVDCEDVDLGALARKVVADLTPTAATAATEVVVDAPADQVVVEADRVRLERVLRNLIVNAATHGGGGQVQVVLRPTAASTEIDQSGVGPDGEPAAGPGVLVEVVDSGPGLPPDPTQVFERFWRADPSRARDTGGAGLGLAIAAEDVALHHGLLRAVSNPAGGSTFRVWLPRQGTDSSTGRPAQH